MVIGDETVHTRPRLQSLRTITKSRSPPAVVITDDSDTFTGINPATSDSLADETQNVPASTASSPNTEHSNRIPKINGIFQSGSFSRASIGSLMSWSQEGVSAIPNPSSFESQIDIHHLSNNIQGDVEDDSQSRTGTKGSSCCSERLRRSAIGILLTLLLASSWIGVAHMLKLTYITSYRFTSDTVQNSTNEYTEDSKINFDTRLQLTKFNAPFFTTWFCTLWNIFFFPIYLGSRILRQSGKDRTKRIIFECINELHEKGFTAAQFFGRCSLFCLLWVVTNYMLIYSLGILDTTDVMALYSSNVSFIYLLSWVVLHQQFVGIRIVAVILCNTGIALLAYMDGVTETPTLGGVVLASAAAAGSAVYKVFLKKLIGDVTSGQLSIFFTLIGLLNLLVMWPFFISLHLTHIETIHWNKLPWAPLGGAAILSLVANLIGNFGIVFTYEVFLTLGLVLAIPASAVIDIYIYGVVFKGMKLAGILLIVTGFLLVLLPNDWPDYVNILLRMRRSYQKRRKKRLKEAESSNGQKSRLRTASGMVK
ncbi:solute carrier family 35 member F3-like [Tachypleus tridentatus]|uniref:solute carrier family 35 member F3-like n=1 Tax=Tachypleus tridentatus TaxID=6853 RepID=UPI003FD41C28